jgi:hemoglobin/transferrin/lactoferrin receptor protein
VAHRMRRVRIGFARCLATSVASLALATPALAQGSESPGLLPAVTVTATGYAAREERTPASVVSIDDDELFARGASHVGDAIRGQPGLAVARDAPAGQNPVLRGLKKESIVLLVDGIRLNSAQPAGAIATLMSLGLAERVEIVKGPASVLYGSGALGGVLNVRLAQARFEPGVQFRGGLRFDSVDTGWRAAAVVNAAVQDHALMLGWSPARVGDYRSPVGDVAGSGYDSDTVIGQYRWRLDDAHQFRLSLQSHEDRDLRFPGSARPGTPPALGTVTVRSPLQRRRLGEVGYTWSGDGNSAPTADVRLYRQEVRRQIRASSAALARDTSETDVTFETTGADTRLTWTQGRHHRLTVGANAWRTEASPERYLSNNPPLFNNRVRNVPFTDGRLQAGGVYAQDDWSLGRAGVLLGVRYDQVEGSAASISNGAITTGLARRDRAVAASAGLIYEVTPTLRPYASAARGFRAGDLRERFESSPRGDGFFYLGNPQIQPEVATQLELGLKGLDATVDYALAVYRIRIEDYITGRVTGAVQAGLPVKQTVNLGAVTIRGIEGRLRWQPLRDHWLQAGFSALRATNDDLNEPLFQSPADELFVGWEAGVAEGLTADAGVRLVRRQNRVATVFARGTENPTAGFGTADLGLTWTRGLQRVRVALSNVFDKRYHEHLDDGVSGAEPAAPGRNVFVSWQGRF